MRLDRLTILLLGRAQAGATTEIYDKKYFHPLLGFSLLLLGPAQ
jgi:hypothetical protein